MSALNASFSMEFRMLGPFTASVMSQFRPWAQHLQLKSRRRPQRNRRENQWINLSHSQQLPRGHQQHLCPRQVIYQQYIGTHIFVKRSHRNTFKLSAFSQFRQTFSYSSKQKAKLFQFLKKVWISLCVCFFLLKIMHILCWKKLILYDRCETSKCIWH